MWRWGWTFVLCCLGAVGFVYLGLWAFGAFSGSGLGTNGVVALILGTIISLALGVGLAALTFYSDRSGQDDDVNNASKR
mgnify:FL=1